MMTHIGPRVFVPYSTHDKKFIDKLVDGLRASQIDVWYDDWEIQPGDSLEARILEEGIDSCDMFVIYLTEYSIKSEWRRKELNKDLAKEIEGYGLSLSVFVDSENTLKSVPKELESLRIPVINDEQYSRSLAQLISRA